MNSCPDLNQLMNEGTIKRADDGKYVMADGSRIWKLAGETLAQAAKRQHKPSTPQMATNYITVACEEDEDEEDEEEEEEVYAVERQPKVSKEK